MATRKSKKTIEQALPEQDAQACLVAEPSDVTAAVADHEAGQISAQAPASAASAAEPATSSYAPAAVDTIYSAAISTGDEKGRFIEYPDSPFHLYQP